jgi:hypothetical protein
MNVRICFVLVGVFMINCLWAQNQSYSGPFGDGQATYEYYENDKYERIYNGNFVYTATISKIKTQWKGKFKGGRKDGPWIYETIPQAGANMIYGFRSYAVTGSTKMIGNYKEGTPVGDWKYTQNFSAGGNVIFRDVKMKYDQNGNCVGPFFLSAKETLATGEVQQFVQINGQCVNGLMDGKWILQGLGIEEIRMYKQGFLLESIVRDKQTGKVSTSFIYQEMKSESSPDILALLDSTGIGECTIIDSTVYDLQPATRRFNIGGFWPCEGTGYYPMNSSMAGILNELLELHESISEESAWMPIPMLSKVVIYGHRGDRTNLKEDMTQLMVQNFSGNAITKEEHDKIKRKVKVLDCIDRNRNQLRMDILDPDSEVSYYLCNLKLYLGEFDFVLNYEFPNSTNSKNTGMFRMKAIAAFCKGLEFETKKYVQEALASDFSWEQAYDVDIGLVGKNIKKYSLNYYDGIDFDRLSGIYQLEKVAMRIKIKKQKDEEMRLEQLKRQEELRLAELKRQEELRLAELKYKIQSEWLNLKRRCTDLSLAHLKKQVNFSRN